MRPTFPEIYMAMAHEFARRSTCKRLHVGTVITTIDFRKVLAVGYNGNASCLPNTCDREEPGNCGCFVGSTRVSAPGVVRTYRRWYEGKVVRVRTINGDFTCTPNHPILTPTGWMSAELLEKQDKLLCSPISTLPMAGVHDHDRMPLEEIFKTSLISSRLVRRTGARHDFHGDGLADQHVDIVSSDRSLLRNSERSVTYPVCDCGFEHSDVITSSRHRESTRHELIACGGYHTGVLEALVDDYSGHAKTFGQRRDGLSALPTCDNISNGQDIGSGAFVANQILRSSSEQTLSSETVLDRRVRHTQGIRDIDDLVASAVATCDVLDVQHEWWSGHVYNLQTESGVYYLNGGITVKNCLHSEENAVINCDAPRETPKLVFCTHLPCAMCAKRLINLGNVRTVYYARDYRLRESIDLFARAGINVAAMGNAGSIEEAVLMHTQQRKVT